MWYGLKIGLGYQETLDLPFGELRSLIAIEQIKNEGADQKKTALEEESEFWELLERR